MSTLAEIEEKQIIEGLGKLKSGHLPPDIFFAIARLVVTPTFVTVPLVYVDNQLRVYLKRRPATDRGYPNMLHPVGKIILSTDESLAATYRRLQQSELKEVSIKRGPVFVDIVFEEISRGKEVSLVHWIELNTIPDVNNLYDPYHLPKEIIPTDIKRIEKAADHFKSTIQKEGNNS